MADTTLIVISSCSANTSLRSRSYLSAEMAAVLRLDELTGNPHPVRHLAHTAFEEIANTQVAANLLHIHRTVLIDEARITSYDKRQKYIILFRVSDGRISHWCEYLNPIPLQEAIASMQTGQVQSAHSRG